MINKIIIIYISFGQLNSNGITSSEYRIREKSHFDALSHILYTDIIKFNHLNETPFFTLKILNKSIF